jgi:UDPglucose 6-dehydrogenase
VRDSPALDVAVRLHGLGADVIVTDPQAIANSRQLHPQLKFADDERDALCDAEVVVLATEWERYRKLDPVEAGLLVRRKIIVDGRNCLDATSWRAAGWRYVGLGRP